MRLPLVLCLAITSAAALEPGDPVDYSKLAFYPKRWKEQKHDTELVPWKGKQIVFLTMSDAHDPEVMGTFVGHLDAGWKLYADLTGRKPAPHRTIDGLATIAAVPGGGLTCGYGCGYVGATGIEMTNFYGQHLPGLAKDPKNVPHAYFYEMGRNYYTFGRRHDCFTTGFAVFMRYVCTDTLKLTDQDRQTRKVINEAIGHYAKTELPFLRTFTNADGLSEKKNRLKQSPTDQPVMYASAMLHLWKTHGNEWLRSFFRQLATCPESDQRTKEGALSQCLAWYVSASCAAGQALSPTFVDQWRLPLTDAQQAILKAVDWRSRDLEAGPIVRSLSQAKE